MQLTLEFGVKNSKIRILLLFLFILLFLLLTPWHFTLAESQHFNESQVSEGVVFLSNDGVFKLKTQADGLNKPLDIYLFNKSSNNISELNVLTDIYSYYVYSNEVSKETEFSVTISYTDSDHSGSKTVYYYNTQKKMWEMASTRAFLNDLTFTMKGQKNQIIVVGTNLAETSTNQEDDNHVSTVYSFDVNSKTSGLKSTKVCLPYLSSYFRNSTDNDREEVKKLQSFLNKYEGFNDLPLTGYYGVMTQATVKKFQEKYVGDILASWDLTSGTGWVLESTLTKINQLYCEVYNKDKFYYELTIPYEISDKNAKVAYYLDQSKNSVGEWIELESFDDSKNKQVTAITNQEVGEITLFKSKNQWVGEASWYSWNGGLYAASRDFPKGTKLKITNQGSGANRGKSAIITVNDYGPELWTNRIIDLDKVAFEKIGNLKSGVMPVKVELYQE